jgi:hypothetical protein
MARDFYEVLDVSDDASTAEVQRAFRERAREFHPDVNDHPRSREQFALLTAAREVLTDPVERDRYDELGHQAYVEQCYDELPSPQMTTDADREPQDDGPEEPPTDRGRQVARSGGKGHGSRFTPGRTEPPTGGTDRDRSPERHSQTSGTTGGGAGGPAGGGAGGTAGGGAGGTAGGRAGGTAGGGAGGTAGGGAGGPATNPGATNDPSSAPGGPPGSKSASAAGGGTDPGARAGGVSWEKAKRRQAARQLRTRGHLTASFQWIPLVLAAVLYGFGLGRYLRVNRTGLDATTTALGTGSLVSKLELLHGRSGVLTSLGFVQEVGPAVRPELSFGFVFVAGSVALGTVAAWSVRELRRTTNWSPSWLHAALAAGPAASLVLALLVERFGGGLGVPTVPLWVDGLLLVACPAVAVFSFLLNRFMLVLPLVRTVEGS